MATAEERQKILEMVAAGQLGAGEAADLLKGPHAQDVEPATEPAQVGADAPAEPKVPTKPEAPARPDDPVREAAGDSPSGGPRWLKVRVGDLKSGRRKVSVNIPLGLMKFGLQVGRSFAPGLRDVDWEELSATLDTGEGGLLVDVQDEEDEERVQIYVE